MRDPQGGHLQKRFVVWFNGNGIPERYWIPSSTGMNYDITPCLTPIARVKDDVLVLSGLDNTYGGAGHPQSLCALMTCTRLNSTGPSAPSLDQALAAKIGGNSRFRSLQIGVSQESFGGALQKNMTWAGPNRPLPPEEIPHRLFDRLFGAKDLGWINRKRSILDALAAGRRNAAKGPSKRRCDAPGRASFLDSRPGTRCHRTTSELSASDSLPARISI